MVYDSVVFPSLDHRPGGEGGERGTVVQGKKAVPAGSDLLILCLCMCCIKHRLIPWMHVARLAKSIMDDAVVFSSADTGHVFCQATHPA